MSSAISRSSPGLRRLTRTGSRTEPDRVAQGLRGSGPGSPLAASASVVMAAWWLLRIGRDSRRRLGPNHLTTPTAKPRLSPWSRWLFVERVLVGRPAAHVAAEMGVSRATAYKWLARHRAEGRAGLVDRPTDRAPAPPARTPARRRRSWRCVATGAWARRRSPGSWACIPSRFTGTGPSPCRAAGLAGDPPLQTLRPGELVHVRHLPRLTRETRRRSVGTVMVT